MTFHALELRLSNIPKENKGHIVVPNSMYRKVESDSYFY